MLVTRGGRRVKTDRYTANKTLDRTNHWVAGDTDGGTFTITLPASPTNGDTFTIFNVGSSGNNLTVARNGNNIRGAAADLILTDGQQVLLTYETTENWWGTVI